MSNLLAPEAERAVLAECFHSRDAVGETLGIIDAEMFDDRRHRAIFAAMVSLWESGEGVDTISLADVLREQGILEASGGVSYLAGLFNYGMTGAQAPKFARIVRDKFKLRELASLASNITEQVQASDVETAMEFAERGIHEIAQHGRAGGFDNSHKAVDEALDKIEYLYKRKGELSGLGTGFCDLDRMTTGFEPGDLVVLAGRPSMGKTSLAMNIVANVGVRQRKPVGVFSLEMTQEQLMFRMICSEARLDSQRVRMGFTRDEEWPLVIHAASALKVAPIHIDESGGISILEARAKARRLHREHNLSLLVVDYLQLLKAKKENRQQEIAEIVQGLKVLAKDLKIPVLALSQLSRAVEQRSNHRPLLSDLRESGSIEQEADIVLFVHREEKFNPTSENEGKGEIIIGKQRNGPIGTVRVTFQGKFTTF